MRNFTGFLVTAAAATMLTGCLAARPTQVTTTWQDRSLAPVQFRK